MEKIKLTEKDLHRLINKVVVNEMYNASRSSAARKREANTDAIKARAYKKAHPEVNEGKLGGKIKVNESQLHSLIKGVVRNILKESEGGGDYISELQQVYEQLSGLLNNQIETYRYLQQNFAQLFSFKNDLVEIVPTSIKFGEEGFVMDCGVNINHHNLANVSEEDFAYKNEKAYYGFMKGKLEEMGRDRGFHEIGYVECCYFKDPDNSSSKYYDFSHIYVEVTLCHISPDPEFLKQIKDAVNDRDLALLGR